MILYIFLPGTRNKVLKLRGAFQENQTLETSKLRYYINRDLETELGVVVRFPVLCFLFDKETSCVVPMYELCLSTHLKYKESNLITHQGFLLRTS